ncbi:MAG: hypothetical protein IPF96_09465 [Rhodobacter sp.]|nr:hypothetical protein [Rhodobacter sp.]
MASSLVALALRWPTLRRPLATPLVTIVEYGIYCRPERRAWVDAPETALGYINLF